jgi:hypothetical protein
MADDLLVMDRGQGGHRRQAEVDEDEIRRYLTV